MEKSSLAGLKRFALHYLPTYLVLVFLAGGTVYVATGLEVGWKLALTAIICVPLAGVVTGNALLNGLKWLVLYYLPCYVGAFVLCTGFMLLTSGGMQIPWDLLPVIGILCVPLAGLLAASLSIPLS